MTLALIELDPDAAVPEHSHENEQLGILVEGSLTFTIGGELGEVLPGGSWRILANVPHSVVAGPEGAVLVEVFSPPRHDWAAIPRASPAPAGGPSPAASSSPARRPASTGSGSTREPVRIDRVRVHRRARPVPAAVVPALRRLRRLGDDPAPRAADAGDEDLLCHELCHVWQMQHHPRARCRSPTCAPATQRNPYEAEARGAVEATRELTSSASTGRRDAS